MKIRLLVVIAILAIGFQKYGLADNEHETTTEQLLKACNSANNLQKIYCIAYINGVLEAFKELRYGDYLNEVLYCRPKNSTQKQSRRIFINHARAYPEEWHNPAPTTIIVALHLAFPCK